MSQPKKTTGYHGSPILSVGVVLASQIGFLVIGIVLVAVIIGIWLDKMLSSKPVFTILLLLGSGPLSLYVVFRLATSAVAKLSEDQGISVESDEENKPGGHEE